MRGSSVRGAVFAGTLVACGSLAGGCGASPSGMGACSVVPFVSPVSATADHAAAPPGNSVQFATGTNSVGTSCVQNALRVNYAWQVSDTTDASITSPGGLATCTAAAPVAITVSSYISSIDSSGKTTYVPSGLPSATLTCK